MIGAVLLQCYWVKKERHRHKALLDQATAANTALKDVADVVHHSFLKPIGLSVFSSRFDFLQSSSTRTSSGL
jgi:hypothetical protein